MIEVKKFEMTCGACPSQWEGRTIDNRPIYARYRWGFLSVYVGETGGDVYNAINTMQVYGEQLGDEMHGVMSTEELINITSGIVNWYASTAAPRAEQAALPLGDGDGE